MRRLVAAGALVLALAGCSTGSPKADLQSKANDLVSAANAGDPAAVRTAGGRLLEEVRTQESNGDLTVAKAQTIQVLVSRIMANAGLLAPSPSPVPSPSSAAPSPSPSPSPSPPPSPSPSPSPSPPPPSPSPAVVPSVEVSTGPSAPAP